MRLFVFVPPSLRVVFATVSLPLVVAIFGYAEEALITVTPRIPEKEIKLPSLPPPVFSLPVQEINVADDTAKAVARLQRAAKEIRILEVWSLDPSVFPAEEKERKSTPYPFHGFHSLGREELKDKEEIQRLLFSVTLAIAQGPDESYDCFAPRHGLRIYDQEGFLDVVLCYSCLQGVIYDGKDEMRFSTTKAPETGFDGIFEKLNLRKAN